MRRLSCSALGLPADDDLARRAAAFKPPARQVFGTPVVEAYSEHEPDLSPCDACGATSVSAAWIPIGADRATRLTARPLANLPSPGRALKIGRNEACPCSSGLKYKKCCGRPAR